MDVCLIQMYTDNSLPVAHSSAGSQTDILCLIYFIQMDANNSLPNFLVSDPWLMLCV